MKNGTGNPPAAARILRVAFSDLDLKKTILNLCSHSDPHVRSSAIYVLCFYWGMEEYKEKAWEMFSDLNCITCSLLDFMFNEYQIKQNIYFTRVNKKTASLMRQS